MILADSSVWIDLLKGKALDQALLQLGSEDQLCCHPWIVGELIVGNLGPKRDYLIKRLWLLPQLPVRNIYDLGDFVEREKLFGKGLSLVDIQLLYVALAENSLLWTQDKILKRAAESYKIAYLPG